MAGCDGGLVGGGDVAVKTGVFVDAGAVVGTCVFVDIDVGVASGNAAGVKKLQARTANVITTGNSIRLFINSPSLA